ncbi:MAG: radical SAM protein, partial [bacterium]|nr:radical SAM protein [bacterium]
VTRIKSNAYAMGGAVARRLKDEIDPYLVEISLHGARAETHDRQTRMIGSFERLMQNVREMQEVGLRISFNATLTRWNEDEIEAMFALADRQGVALAVNAVVSPRDDGDREPLTIAASPKAEERLYRLLEERQATAACPEGEPTAGRPTANGGKSCGAGAATLAVDPFGNVFPCVQWRRPMGNVHRQSIREIWTESSALAEVRSINTAAGERIDQLPLGRKLGFCVGLAEELTGDPLAIYPAAQCKIEILERLEKTTK